MSRDGSFSGYSRGEARTRTARSLNFDGTSSGLLGKMARLPWGFILLIVAIIACTVMRSMSLLSLL